MERQRALAAVAMLNKAELQLELVICTAANAAAFELRFLPMERVHFGAIFSPPTGLQPVVLILFPVWGTEEQSETQLSLMGTRPWVGEWVGSTKQNLK